MKPDWSAADELIAKEALHRYFGESPNLATLWSADTARDWAGTGKGLTVSDTRVHIKNNAEYHGLETHAWQFMATAQYAEAAAYFYVAALWRRMDGQGITDWNNGLAQDAGHAKAEAICLKCGRFALALSAGVAAQPESYDLEEAWVAAREKKAERQLEESQKRTK